MIVNLLSNALRFTTRGGVTVKVTCISNETSNDINNENKIDLQFAIKDTGCGIPREKFSKLFQMFSQVDSSYTRSHGGSGLGLGKLFVELYFNCLLLFDQYETKV